MRFMLGNASSGLAPVMNCLAMVTMLERTPFAAILAAMDSGESRFMPHCRARGKSCPGRQKYSWRWRATEAEEFR